MIADGAQTASIPAIATLPARKRLAPKRKSWGLTPVLEAKIRTLYLVRNMPPRDIAAEMQVDVRAVNTLARRRGWAAARRAAWAEQDAASEAALTKDVARFTQQVAAEAEELTIGSLQMVRESIADKDAKSLSMSSTAVRNLVDVARRTRGLDSREGSHSTISLNFIAAPRAERPMKVVSAAPIQDAQVAINVSANPVPVSAPGRAESAH